MHIIKYIYCLAIGESSCTVFFLCIEAINGSDSIFDYSIALLSFSIPFPLCRIRNCHNLTDSMFNDFSTLSMHPN